MEVTCRNFKDVLPQIQQAIDEATFLTIDAEFTGLSDGKHENINSYDTPEDRYHKLRLAASEFQILQYGISAFTFHPETTRYTSQSFNFYIFPRPFSKQAPDPRFLSQSSSLDFLISQGFDFNKVFREGISYLTPAVEDRLKSALEQRQKLYKDFSSPAFTTPDCGTYKSPAVVPEEHKEFIEAIYKQVEDFIKDDERNSMELKPCNGYLRKLTYQTVQIRFKSNVHLEAKTLGNKQRCVVVTKCKGENDLKILEEAKKQAEWQELEDAVGFSKVIRHISQSGKIVVGHNMYLDILHTLRHFCSPLPEDYEDFKALTRCVFPRIVDTKLMANTQPFKERIYSSALGDLQKILALEPFTKPVVETPEGFPSYNDGDDDNLHQAGYDSYITGLCYIGMANFLGLFHDPIVHHVLDKPDFVKPFTNRIFLMRIYDVPYMNLTGEDEKPSRDHVFHVTFPADWKTSDISSCFSPLGNVQVSWLTDTSAYVALFRKDQAHHVLKTIKNGDGLKVVPYAVFKGGAAASVEPASRKRQRSMSDTQMPAKKPKHHKTTFNLNASPFVCRVITPIQEEEEGDNGEPATVIQPHAADQAEDLGEPVMKKKKETGATNGKAPDEKLFAEEPW